ncbi:MAG: GIY-YIG nuclease family protein [Acidiferrobacteraceae bacterium]
MATFRKRSGPGGRMVWQARIRRRGHVDQARTFDLKGEAEAWAAGIESSYVAPMGHRRAFLRYLDPVDEHVIRAAVTHWGSDDKVASQPGYVYIALSSSLGPEKVKIGRTGTIERRMTELSRSSGAPEPFRCVYAQRFLDMVTAEALLHQVLQAYRINENREFFAIPVQYAMEVMDFLHALLRPGKGAQSQTVAVTG